MSFRYQSFLRKCMYRNCLYNAPANGIQVLLYKQTHYRKYNKILIIFSWKKLITDRKYLIDCQYGNTKYYAIKITIGQHDNVSTG